LLSIYRGYWPANALPVANQSTLCGANCAQVNFVQQGDRVKVFSGNTNVTLVDEDVVVSSLFGCFSW
jgi:hypothetical protein